MGGVVLVLLDSLMNFRLEYLYPVLMFIRSVYDSYKYQGFVSWTYCVYLAQYYFLSLDFLPFIHLLGAVP